MGSTAEMRGKKVYRRRKRNPDRLHKVGKVKCTIFYPDQPRVYGYLVKRGDLLLMFKRKDKFIAADSCDLVDGRIVAQDGDAVWDDDAIKRIGEDYDTCIIWEEMDIRTEDGIDLGHVGSVEFGDDGIVTSMTASDSSAAKTLLGVYKIPVEMIKGYSDGRIYVTAAAKDIEYSGGLAAKAGAASAKAKNNMTKANAKAGEAINEGAYKLGEGIGKAKDTLSETKQAALDNGLKKPQVSKKEAAAKAAQKEAKSEAAAKAIGEHLGKAGGMFSAFKEEYKKGVSGKN